MPPTPKKAPVEPTDAGAPGEPPASADTLEEAIEVGYLGQVVDNADYTFAARTPDADTQEAST